MHQLMPNSPHSMASPTLAVHVVDGVDSDKESTKDYFKRLQKHFLSWHFLWAEQHSLPLPESSKDILLKLVPPTSLTNKHTYFQITLVFLWKNLKPAWEV